MSIRGSALWGKKEGGDSRGSALWGKGARGAALLLAAVALFAFPAVAVAKDKDVLKDAKSDNVVSITRDTQVTADGYDNPQHWDQSVGVKWFWGSPLVKRPAATIAVVDSGIDNSIGNFGNRILTQVDMGGGS